MSDDIKKLKDEEQENWAWDYDSESSNELKRNESSSNDDSDNKALVKGLLIALGVGLLVFVSLGSGAAPFANIGQLIGRFWWMIFIIPMFTSNRSPNWVGIACLFLLFSGALGGMWWLIFLVPMFMGKRSRSC